MFSVNGRQETVSAHNMESDEICKWVEHIRTRSGAQIMRVKKQWHTDTPSVQGIWHPFLHKDPSLATTPFPAPQLYRAKQAATSATDMVVEDTLAKKVADIDLLSSKE